MPPGPFAMTGGEGWRQVFGRIRKGANPQCGLTFVDTSRPGKRRWCSMDRCGNMMKLRTYRERHRRG